MSILPCKGGYEEGNFACAQSGCRSCVERLILANEGLVHAYLQRQVIGGMAYADLLQEGRIALWRAVLKFDPQRGTAFSTYAWQAIRHQVWGSIRQANQSHLWMEAGGLWSPIHELAEQACWRAEVQRALLASVACLPQRLRAVIIWVYGLDGQSPRSMAALGRRWGLTRERIRQLRNQALVLLRLPAFSAELRELCARDSREAYREGLRLNRQWLARRRH